MKLAQQIALLLFAAVLIAVVAMGTLIAFNLNRGFTDYLQLRQLAHFDAIEKRLTSEAQRFGSLEHLRDRPRAWRAILAAQRDEQTGRDGAESEDAMPFRDHPPADESFGERDGRRPPPKDRPARGDRRKDGFKATRDDPLGLGPRFHLFDAAHRPMHPGVPPAPAGSAAPIERAIRLGGEAIAYVVHTPVAKAPPEADDAVFLRRQLFAIGTAGIALLGLALLLAPFVARRWSRAIDRTRQAAARIAKGEFDVRLPDDRPDEIGDLMRSVNAMASSLAALDRTRKRWLAESAHELRTPLAVLRGEIEALQDGVRRLDAAALRSLADEVRHLTKLVDDLHLLSLADMGALPCTMQPIDLIEVAHRIVSRFRAAAERKELSLETRLPAAARINADQGRIEQLLTNLIENSMRYTDAPGRIVVRVTLQARAIVLCIEDSAPGATTAECERLFEPLYRADAARSRAAGGSGLGLAICRAIVQAHGGSIAAAPSDAGGLAVTAVLPRFD